MRTRTFIALFLAAVIMSISATPTSLAGGRFQSGKTGDGVKELVESARTSKPARSNLRDSERSASERKTWRPRLPHPAELGKRSEGALCDVTIRLGSRAVAKEGRRSCFRGLLNRYSYRRTTSGSTSIALRAGT